MYLCIHKRRLEFNETSSSHEVYNKTIAKSRWPKYKVYIEWSDDKYVEIHDEAELRLASKLVSASLNGEIKEWTNDFARREDKAARHMAEPDSDPDDEMHSEDDLTLDDWYSMGYRHETET